MNVARPFDDLDDFVLAKLGIDPELFDERAAAYGAMEAGLTLAHSEMDDALAQVADELADQFVGGPSEYQIPEWFVDQAARRVEKRLAPSTLARLRRAFPVDA